MILVVEDSPARIEVFREYFPDCVVASTYRAAVSAFKAHTFEVLWLDHDILGPKNGCDVAYWIATKLPRSKLPKIHVHSWSRTGAKAIQQTLNTYGIECEVEPFSEELLSG